MSGLQETESKKKMKEKGRGRGKMEQGEKRRRGNVRRKYDTLPVYLLCYLQNMDYYKKNELILSTLTPKFIDIKKPSP